MGAVNNGVLWQESALWQEGTQDTPGEASLGDPGLPLQLEHKGLYYYCSLPYVTHILRTCLVWYDDEVFIMHDIGYYTPQQSLTILWWCWQNFTGKLKQWRCYSGQKVSYSPCHRLIVFLNYIQYVFSMALDQVFIDK